MRRRKSFTAIIPRHILPIPTPLSLIKSVKRLRKEPKDVRKRQREESLPKSRLMTEERQKSRIKRKSVQLLPPSISQTVHSVLRKERLTEPRKRLSPRAMLR